jgi:hypothetical protein
MVRKGKYSLYNKWLILLGLMGENFGSLAVTLG